VSGGTAGADGVRRRTVNEHYLRLFRTPYLKVIILSDTDPAARQGWSTKACRARHRRTETDQRPRRRLSPRGCGSPDRCVLRSEESSYSAGTVVNSRRFYVTGSGDAQFAGWRSGERSRPGLGWCVRRSGRRSAGMVGRVRRWPPGMTVGGSWICGAVRRAGEKNGVRRASSSPTRCPSRSRLFVAFAWWTRESWTLTLRWNAIGHGFGPRRPCGRCCRIRRAWSPSTSWCPSTRSMTGTGCVGSSTAGTAMGAGNCTW
jgi:hypothetical protein